MNQKQNKTAYFILIFLIILAIAVVGGLIMVLFNTSIPQEKNIPMPDPILLQTNLIENTTPVSEEVIEVQIEEIPIPEETEPKSTATITPAICEGCGSQIRSRDAYKYPATYTANIQPNHIKFTIYADRKSKSK